MNVLIIDSANLTPPYTSSLCDALIKNGCNLKLVCSNNTDKEQQFRLNLFSTIFIPKHEKFKTFIKFLKGINHLLGLIRLVIYIKKNPVDIIHFQISPLPWMDKLFLGTLKKESIVVGTIHNTTPFHGGANFLQRYGFKSLIKNYDFYVVHTVYSMQILKKHFQVQNKEVLVINHPLFNTIQEMNNMKYHDIEKTKVKILYFGIISKYKGVDTLIHALSLLDDYYLNQIELTIAGKLLVNKKHLLNAPYNQNINSLIKWELGWVEDAKKRELLLNAHLITLPYLHIDGSGVLADAFEYNLPLIASNIGGFSESIVDKKMGYLVRPKDPQKLSETIKKMIDNKTFLYEMSQNVHDEALKLDNWDDIAKKIIRAYSSLNAIEKRL